MKRIVLVITLVLSLVLLTGCNKIEVEPGVLNVVYENPRFEDDNFYIDTYITNGLDEDYYVGNMDFTIYLGAENIDVASAGFYIDELIPSGEYVGIELEFSSEYIFFTEQDLEDIGYNADDLDLYFWFE